MQPEIVNLSNGIPVILQNDDAPVAATYWWIKAGSADEQRGEEGFAHYLEHMLFKDAAAKETGRASTGQTAREIEGLGGDINAYTSFDQTVYHVTCAAQHWEQVFKIFARMAKPQRFLQTDFAREREVILEELRKNEDSPGRQLFQALFSTTFKEHPYGRPVIGYPRTLKAATVQKLEAFYRRHYISGKMGLILVGPFGTDPSSPLRKKLLALAEKSFGAKVLKPQKAEFKPRRAEKPTRATSTWVQKKFDVKSSTASISFRVPDLAHDDVPALDLLAGILGAGELSRVYQRLFYQLSLATEASGGMYIPRDPGMMYFQAEVDHADKLEPATRELIDQLRRIQDEGVTAEELERVIVNTESEKLYATQSTDGIAGRLGFLQFMMGDLDHDEKYLARLRAVTSDRLREVARKYLHYTRMNGVYLTPKDAPKVDFRGIAAYAKERLSQAAPTRSAEQRSAARRNLRGSSKEFVAERFTLPSGTRVAYYERPDSSAFSIHASCLGGLRLEIGHPLYAADEDWGVSNLLAATWTKGTDALTSQQIARVVEGRAASLDGFSGRNTIGLQAMALSRDWGEISSLFTDVLVGPRFAAEEIEHSRRVAEEDIRSIPDHSAQLCTKVFLENLFEAHPYGKLTTGSLESLQTMSTEKLRRYHAAWVRPDRLTISVAGAVPRAQLDAWLERLDQATSRLRDGGASTPLLVKPEAALRAPRWQEVRLGREQTHIIVGSRGSTLGHEDRYAIRLLQTILGGQSGRLFIELREKRSLAYTVAPISFDGLEPGYIGTYIACSPGKKEEAVGGIRRVLEDFAKKGAKGDEIARARRYLVGRRAMDLQGDSTLAAHFGLDTLYGLPQLTEAQIAQKYDAITSRQLQDLTRRYLLDAPQVTCTIG